MMTRQERALRNAVILLAVGCLVLGGIVIWSLRAMAQLKENEAQSESPDAATAGGQTVTEEQWMKELKKKHGDEVLLGMINHIVVQKEAEALGIKVTADQIQQELKHTMAGYASEEQYYAQMQNELGLSPQEVYEETAYRLTLQEIATTGITIEEAEIDHYLELHAERFRTHKELQLSMIKVATYEEAQTVMDRLEQGEDFAELAKELSIDEESAQRGGNMGTVEEGDPFWPEELLTTAAGLDEGDIAGPLQTEDDYAIIRLERVTVPKTPEPAEIRAQIRQELALDQAAPLQEVEKDLRTKYHTRIDIDNNP